MTEPTGRWLRELTQAELKEAMARKDGVMVAEWPGMGKTFLGHRASLTIVRTGALGGDVRTVDGGWLYLNDVTWLMDWSEISYMCDVPANQNASGLRIIRGE